MLDEAAKSILRALQRADGSSFSELIEIAGLNPERDLRDADLGGVDFARCDIRGYDFSGAYLENAIFREANGVEHAIFHRADLHGVEWPAGWQPRADGPEMRSRGLGVAEFIDRSSIVTFALEHCEERYERPAAVLKEINREFLHEMTRRGPSAMMIVPSELIEHIADEVRQDAAAIGAEYDIVVLDPGIASPRWRSATRAAATLIVTTPNFGRDIDLGDVGLVGMLASLPLRLEDVLRHPPVSIVSRLPLRVLDYRSALRALEPVMAGAPWTS